MQDAGRDQRYDPVALRRRLGVDQAGKTQPLDGAQRRGGMAVRQGALNLEGFRQPLNGGSALEQHAQALDHFGGPFRQVGQGAFFDCAAFAPAFAQKDGRRRVAVRDGINIHGNYYSV